MKQFTVKDGKATPNGGERPSKRPTIHTVTIIDASGSMNDRDHDGYQTKYQAAIDGVNQELKELRKDKKTNYLVSIYEFDSLEVGKERITQHCLETPLKSVETITGRGASGNTPLYQTVGFVIEHFLRKSKKDEKVLLKIFTDGFHNCMWGKYGSAVACKELIQDAEKNAGFVITFVGTENDVRRAVTDMGIYASNAMAYDGSARDLKAKMSVSTMSTMNYATNVARGTATTDNFYTNSQVGDTIKLDGDTIKDKLKPKAKAKTKTNDNN